MTASSTNTSLAPAMNERIYSGNGEYVAFYEGDKHVDRDTFAKMYKIFNENSPAAIAYHHSESVKEFCESRFDRIRGAVKKVDPNLHIAFIPKTLYELTCIVECIKEDLDEGKLCFRVAPTWWGPMFESIRLHVDALEETKSKCWHICRIDYAETNDKGEVVDLTEHNNNPDVREIAFRLNQVIVEQFTPTPEGFTFEELSKHTESKIEFLANHYKTLEKNINYEKLTNCNGPGPTTNFGVFSVRGSIKPMCISGENETQVIRKSLEIDCSDVARRAFILYIGKRWFYHPDDTSSYQTYGQGLFHGGIFGAAQCPFQLIKKYYFGYVTTIPYEKLHDSPFQFAPTNTVVQLYSLGHPWNPYPNIKEGVVFANIKIDKDNLIVLIDRQDEARGDNVYCTIA